MGEYPKRSATTSVAGWMLLGLTAVSGILNLLTTADRLADGSDVSDGAALSGEESTAVVVVALVILVTVHVWTALVGRGLLRRRRWARWGAIITCGTFGTLSLINASVVATPGVFLWLSLVPNFVIVALLFLPRTARDVWWAEMARTRPDYVEERRVGTRG